MSAVLTIRTNQNEQVLVVEESLNHLDANYIRKVISIHFKTRPEVTLELIG